MFYSIIAQTYRWSISLFITGAQRAKLVELVTVVRLVEMYPSKIFCRILLGRIETAIDKKLKQEQARFRKRRGCTDQIYALRNISEQTLEWNCQLYINFIDFKKAFDSIHHDTLWNILTSYGVPLKTTTLNAVSSSVIHPLNGSP